MIDFNQKFNNIGHETNQVLSQNVKISFNTYKTGLGSMNTLVIGGTGEGKSRYIVRPVVYSMPCDTRDSKYLDGTIVKNPKMSYVFTDPKGELCRDTAGILKANGYNVKIFNLVDMEHSDCYNPLKYVYYNSNPDQALVVLIDGLVDTSCGKDNKDPHWSTMAKALLKCLAFYIHYELPAELQNFTTMSNLVPLFALAEGETKAPIDDLLANCQQFPIETHPALVWRRKISAQGGELSSIISTAQAALNLWADSNVQKLTDVDTLDLHKIGDTPTAIYIITPSSNDAYDFLVATFYNQMFESLMYKANMIYKGMLPHHVLIVQDEFANTGKIPNYDRKIATFRSCNISSIIIVQSPNQIKSMYEGKNQDILDNIHITIFLGNGGQDASSTDAASAASFMSRALGSTTVKASGKSMSYDKNSGIILEPNVSESINSSQRNLMTPEEVRQLPFDECLIIIRGYKPIRDKKINLDSCLNYGSDLYTYVKENGQRALRKEFEYDPLKKISTLDSYIAGKKSLKILDNIGSENVIKRLIKESSFNKINREKLSKDINCKFYMSHIDLADYIKNNAYEINERIMKNTDLLSVYITKETMQKLQNMENNSENESNNITENNNENNNPIKELENNRKEVLNNESDNSEKFDKTTEVKRFRKFISKKSMQENISNELEKATKNANLLHKKIKKGEIEPENVDMDMILGLNNNEE